MIAAISEWSWMICVLLLRTAAITTVILLAAALAVRWYRGASAAIRHRLWLTAVLGCLATPVVLAFVPSRVLSVTPASVAVSTNETHVSPAIDTAETETVAREHESSAAMPSPRRKVYAPDIDAPAHDREFASIDHEHQPHPQLLPAAPIDTPPSTSVEPRRVVSAGDQLAAFVASIAASRFPLWGAAVWMCIAALLIVRILIAIAATHRLIRRSEECTNSGAFSLLAELCADMRIRVPVGLLLSSEIDVPMLAGVRRPLILLPRDAAIWSRDRLSIVLRHELAHVVRRDLLSQLLADVVASIAWFQPLLWHAARRLRIEREIACDDLVLQTGTTPCDYADQLLAVASTAVSQRRPSLVTVTMAGRSTVEHRIRSILNPNSNRQSVSRTGSACVAAIASIVLIASTHLMPTLSIAPTEATANEPLPIEEGLDVTAPKNASVKPVEKSS
ncbi:MAG: M56 family metallopeptidase, partial [Planctomycetaceae bacterium]